MQSLRIKNWEPSHLRYVVLNKVMEQVRVLKNMLRALADSIILNIQLAIPFP